MNRATVDARLARLGPARDAVATIDGDGRIIGVDVNAERTFGFARESALGRLLFDLVLPAADRPAHLTAFRDWARVAEAHAPARLVQFMGIRADGSVFPAEMTIARVPGSEPALFTGFIRDLSDDRQAERRRTAQYRVAAILAAARSLAEAAPTLLGAMLESFDASLGCAWTVDGDALRCQATCHAGGCDAIHLAFEELCRDARLPLGAALPGRVWQSGEPDYIDDLDASDAVSRAAVAASHGFRSAFAFPVRRGTEVLGVLEFFRRDDLGDEFELRDLFGSLGHQVGQFMAREAAEGERERALERERRARLEAEQANHAKDEFLAIVSHELRTPLNAVLGWATLLKSGSLSDEKRARAVTAIERGARAQAQLIDDLLDVSRAIRGKLTIDRSPTNAAAIATAALELVQPSAQQRRVRLHARGLDQRVPIVGDRTRLQQVIWNLLSNAVKFTPPGGSVTLRLLAEPGAVLFVVEDTGIGIQPDLLPYLFERFRQGDVRGERTQGLGLGLAIVRHIVELHGGRVTAQSEGEGRGSRFTVRLPAGEPPSHDAGAGG
jgi:PAS domain S-box-containing protein